MRLNELQQLNVSRAQRWHPGGLAEWSALEWAGAMAGEAGEACNAAKKLKRIETGVANINRQQFCGGRWQKEDLVVEAFVEADFVGTDRVCLSAIGKGNAVGCFDLKRDSSILDFARFAVGVHQEIESIIVDDSLHGPTAPKHCSFKVICRKIGDFVDNDRFAPSGTVRHVKCLPGYKFLLGDKFLLGYDAG